MLEFDPEEEGNHLNFLQFQVVFARVRRMR